MASFYADPSGAYIAVRSSPVASISFNQLDLGLEWPIGGIDAQSQETIRGSVFGSARTPLGPLAPAGSGFYAKAFERDWYDQIHVIPQLIELGFVLSQTIQTVQVWNGYNVPKAFTAITQSGTEGIALSGGFGTPPLNVGEFIETTYTLTVNVEGPAHIAAIYTWDFGASDMPVLTVTGDRAVVFANEPQRPVSEELIWLTDILESYNGTEQRVALRSIPRQVFQYIYQMHDKAERQNAINALYGNIGRNFAVPVWTDQKPLLADINAGVFSIPVNTSLADFRIGGTAILWNSYNNFDVVDITGVNSLSLDILRATSLAHSAIDTLVIPMQIVFADDTAQVSRTGNGYHTIDMRWRSSEYKDLATDTGLTLYKSMPVFIDTNFLGSDSREEPFGGNAEFLDTNVGVFSVIRKSFPKLDFKKRWEPETAAQVWALRLLIHALRGRQRSFWLPTYRNDFTLTEVIGAADTVLSVERSGYPRYLTLNEPIKHIAIMLKNGTTYYREIINASDTGAVDNLTIDANLGSTIQIADVARISYLVRCRLNTDTVRIDHTGLGRATVEVPVRGVLI